MMKTCSKCKLEFPKTLEFFSKYNTGLRSSCKACQSVLRKAYYEANKDKENLLAKEYYKANSEKCLEVTRTYQKANADKIIAYRKTYHKANSEKLNAKHKAYRIANLDKERARDKAYREANPEKVKAATKAYRLANPEKTAATRKAYREANPDKERAKKHKRRALKLGNGHTPYTEAEMLERYGTVCYLCNEEIDLKAPRSPGAPGYQKSLWKDHVIALTNGGPDTLDNVKPSHALCNQRKGTKEYVYEN